MRIHYPLSDNSKPNEFQPREKTGFILQLNPLQPLPILPKTTVPKVRFKSV
ncbi:hypothetical protein LEP1GSC194_2328 [Leptospira alstonii serovar Sichuan str. 79601]|uniref:Uncharacterized protein n=1 Tax=Leptospira alstonii serovar Sichuan str. 79601 TaxID=1218565 RepID=M6D4J9_9LEPT|nr:hypothetical protein LEP1GSC194_2328 [Leptospira alstonii serovar Sichuan str. 79601]